MNSKKCLAISVLFVLVIGPSGVLQGQTQQQTQTTSSGTQTNSSTGSNTSTSNQQAKNAKQAQGSYLYQQCRPARSVANSIEFCSYWSHRAVP
jgi:uncharacterized protein HemX